MNTFPTKILLATDGSLGAEQAARVAVGLANATGSELHVTYVGSLPGFVDGGPRGRDYNRAVREKVEQESAKVLRRLAWKTKLAGGTVAGTHLRLGGAAREIVDLADELGAGLIIVGGGCRAGVKSLLVGGLPGWVVGHARRPVLVACGNGQPEEAHEYAPGRIVLAFDGSKASLGGTWAATEIAKATGSELHVAYVLEPDRYRPHPGPEIWEGWQVGFEQAKRHTRSWLEERAQLIRGEGVRVVEAHLLLGRPDAGLVWLAETLGAGLIVMGGRGHGRIKKALVGDVSDSVVGHANCPVLVMPPTQERTERKDGRLEGVAGSLRAPSGGVEEQR